MTDDTTERATLSEMSHTNPFTNRSFGETQTFERGKVVAADGGEADAVPADEDDPVTAGSEANESSAGSPETLGEVDHTPPGETEGAHRAYERGQEGKDDVR